MYYHASSFEGIKKLEPRVSNHDVPLIYFSKKKENTFVYLSNAIEKYCKDTGFEHSGKWKKWGPYGFTKDGILELQEYYPDALEKTYKGVSGYIYRAENITDSGFELRIPDAATSSVPVEVSGCEFIPDAYVHGDPQTGRSSRRALPHGRIHQPSAWRIQHEYGRP